MISFSFFRFLVLLQIINKRIPYIATLPWCNILLFLSTLLFQHSCLSNVMLGALQLQLHFWISNSCSFSKKILIKVGWYTSRLKNMHSGSPSDPWVLWGEVKLSYLSYDIRQGEPKLCISISFQCFITSIVSVTSSCVR